MWESRWSLTGKFWKKTSLKTSEANRTNSYAFTWEHLFFLFPWYVYYDVVSYVYQLDSGLIWPIGRERAREKRDIFLDKKKKEWRRFRVYVWVLGERAVSWKAGSGPQHPLSRCEAKGSMRQLGACACRIVHIGCL